MKNLKSHIKILALTSLFSLSSCETNGIYEINDRLAEISITIPYLENQEARYQIDYGQIRVADSLPFINKNGVTYQLNTSKSFLLKEKNLNQQLKISRLAANGTATLESTIPINFANKRKIQLLQFADNSNLSIFEPINPDTNKRTQTNAQFFYSNSNQPPQINITILAIDLYALLLAPGQDPANVSADKKTEIKTFTLNKSTLSEIVTLDLDLFKQPNGLETVFLYKITDTQTGAILQNYGNNNTTTANSKVNISLSPTTRINPVNKFTLFQYKYNTATIPFKSNFLINGDSW